jgi:cell division protein ftsA
MNDRRDIYAVINIGSSSLAGLLATKSPEGRVEPISAYRIPSGGCVRQGSIHNIEEAAQRISSLLDALSKDLPEEATITGVYVGLECRSMRSEHYDAFIDLGPEGSVVTPEHLLTLKDQVNDASYPGMTILSVTEPRYLCDGKREPNPRGVRCRRLEAQYLLLVARQNIIINVRETIEDRLGLRLLGILPTPIAEATATMTLEEMALGCAYVNIGGGTTSITIYKERFPLALFVLPLGGNNITRDLTQLSIPLLDADAERMKVEHGSMNLSVSRTQEIVATSVDGSSTKRFSQIEVNRYINARILEILSNVVSIIHEAGCSESIPKGFVFAGGVTKTDYFYETLRKLSPEYRKASLRRDIYEEGSNTALLEHYITEIALAYQATEPSVTYTLRPLDSLLQEEPTPAPVEPATSVSEPLAEEEAKTYTYTTIGEAQVTPIEEDDEDDFDEEEYEEPTHEERSKHKRSWSFDSVMKGINSLFGSNDSGDDY